MKRDAMVFYRSFYEAGRFLSNEERLDYYDRILNYGIEGVEKEKGEKVEMLFSLIQPNIDSNNNKYVRGKNGGAPKGNSNAKKGFEPKQPVVELENNHRLKKKTTNVDVDVDVEEDVEEDIKEKKKKISFGKFVKLTQEEFDRLKSDFNEQIIDSKIEDVNNYCGSVGKKYKDYNLTIRSWLKKDKSKQIDYTDMAIFGAEIKKDYQGLKAKVGVEKFFELKRKWIDRASLNNKL